jgi:hypothetical protein
MQEKGCSEQNEMDEQEYQRCPPPPLPAGSRSSIAKTGEEETGGVRGEEVREGVREGGRVKGEGGERERAGTSENERE